MTEFVIEIKLMGIIRSAWQKNTYTFILGEEGIVLEELLRKMSLNLGEKFWEFFDKDLTPTRGIIVMLDGADYTVKGGLKAPIDKDSNLVFLSVIHGG